MHYFLGCTLRYINYCSGHTIKSMIKEDCGTDPENECYFRHVTIQHFWHDWISLNLTWHISLTISKRSCLYTVLRFPESIIHLFTQFCSLFYPNSICDPISPYLKRHFKWVSGWATIDKKQAGTKFYNESIAVFIFSYFSFSIHVLTRCEIALKKISPQRK